MYLVGQKQGRTETLMDGTGWTDGHGSRNSYLDIFSGCN